MSLNNIITIADKMASIIATDVQLIGMSEAHEDVLQKFNDFCSEAGIKPSMEVRNALSKRNVDLLGTPRKTRPSTTLPGLEVVDGTIQMVFDGKYSKEMTKEEFGAEAKKILKKMNYNVDFILRIEMLHSKPMRFAKVFYQSDYHHICRVVCLVTLEGSVMAGTEEELFKEVIPDLERREEEKLCQIIKAEKMPVSDIQFRCANKPSDTAAITI